MTQTEVAELLGTRVALLFPRTRPASGARPTTPPDDLVSAVEKGF